MLEETETENSETRALTPGNYDTYFSRKTTKYS